MRTVLEAMLKKAETLSISEIINFVNIMLPKISTNISSTDIIGLAPALMNVNISQSNGWPENTQGSTIGGVYYGVPINLEKNVSQLHKELFDQDDYTCSETVQNISNQIISKTGIK